jgi:hypothetical protein
MSVAPGEIEERGPGDILIRASKPDRAWCQRCEEAHGWLVPNRSTTTALDGPGPRSPSQEARRRRKVHKGKRRKA